MPTNRITTSSSLVDTLRALASDRSKEAQRTARTAQTRPDGKTDKVIAKHDAQALRQRLRDAVEGVDVSDQQSLAQARVGVVREILLWEFESDFRTDAQFLPMVDAIGTALDADPQSQQRFASLIADLRRG
jgi:hypothetical protein